MPTLTNARVPRRRLTRLQIIDRIDTFLRDHVDQPIHVAELCNVTGVSERSLRNACYAVCGTSPKRYLTRRRMEAVRRALEAASPAEATVTRIATDFGFFELGRFAATYNAIYGERPSETLRSGVPSFDA